MMSILLKPAPEKPVVSIKAICQQVCSQVLGMRDSATGEGREQCSEMNSLRPRSGGIVDSDRKSLCRQSGLESGDVVGINRTVETFQG